jgi:hypothetical protein
MLKVETLPLLQGSSRSKADRKFLRIIILSHKQVTYFARVALFQEPYIGSYPSGAVQNIRPVPYMELPEMAKDVSGADR